MAIRPLQLTAGSLAEFRKTLPAVAEASLSHAAMVSRNFGFMDRRDFSRDGVVTRRFIDLRPHLPGSWPGLAVRRAEQAVRCQ